MQWPWVSRRAYDLLYAQYERTIADRDAQQERADRAMDMLAVRNGFEPTSAPVRAEVAALTQQTQLEIERYLQQANEDPGMGMIDEEYVDEVAAGLAPSTTEVV